jgi:hypothetical protein
MTDDKPREFWVQKSTPDYVCDSQQELLECRTSDMMGVPFYRVIEISALNKLNKQLELTKAFLEAALGDCKDAEVAEEMAGNYKKAMDGPRK